MMPAREASTPRNKKVSGASRNTTHGDQSESGCVVSFSVENIRPSATVAQTLSRPSKYEATATSTTELESAPGSPLPNAEKLDHGTQSALASSFAFQEVSSWPPAIVQSSSRRSLSCAAATSPAPAGSGPGRPPPGERTFVQLNQSESGWSMACRVENSPPFEVVAQTCSVSSERGATATLTIEGNTPGSPLPIDAKFVHGAQSADAKVSIFQVTNSCPFEVTTNSNNRPSESGATAILTGAEGRAPGEPWAESRKFVHASQSEFACAEVCHVVHNPPFAVAAQTSRVPSETGATATSTAEAGNGPGRPPAGRRKSVAGAHPASAPMLVSQVVNIRP